MENKRAALALLIVAPAFGASYRFGALWDGDKLQKNVCLTTQADKIQSVGTCNGIAIDLSRYTAIPGLIDGHTHLTYVLDNPVNQSGRSAAVVFLAQENARKTLEAGVTTVRNLGAAGYTDIAMRDLINKGLMAGPRMFVAGYGLQITRGTTPSPETRTAWPTYCGSCASKWLRAHLGLAAPGRRLGRHDHSRGRSSAHLPKAAGELPRHKSRLLPGHGNPNPPWPLVRAG